MKPRRTKELEPKKKIKQHGFFVCSLLMVWFLLQIGSGHLHAVEPLEVDLSVSPTTVDADHTFVVNVLISNRGDSDQAVSSVDLVFPPWQSSDETGTPFNLTPGQTGVLGLNVRAPSNASDGKHDIFVEVGLPEGITILANSSIQVERITGFSLAGELPVAVVGIIVAGIVAYFIIAQLRLSAERNTSEINIGILFLIAIPYGVISWYILFLLLGMDFAIDSVGQSPPHFYVAAVGISAALAFVSYVLYLFFGRSIEKASKAFNYLANYWHLKESVRVGVSQGPKIWLSTLGNINRVRNTIGLRYGYKVRVSYNDNSGITKELEGFLWKYDIESPYNIVLSVRYLAACSNKHLFINTLINHEKLSDNFRKDRKYRKRLQKFLDTDDDRLGSNVKARLKFKLLAASYQNIHSVLSEIDFSLYVRDVIREMNLSLHRDYGELTFISGTNIVSLRVLQFDTNYAMRLFLNLANSTLIPESIPLNDSRLPRLE